MNQQLPIVYRDTIADNLRLSDGKQLPRVVLDIWESRPDLQAAYPQPLAAGNNSLFSWLINCGFDEYLGLGHFYQFYVLQDCCQFIDLDISDSLSVAVVLPTKDRPDFLRKALHSLCKQTYSNWQLYLVDGSQDSESRELAEEILGAQKLCYLKDQAAVEMILEERIAAARNLGMVNSSQDLIAHIDDDNIWHPNHLAKLVQPFVDNNELGMSFSLHRGIDSQTGLCLSNPARFAHNAFQVFSVEALHRGNFIASDDVVMKRSVFETIGGIREDLPFYADWEYWCRITKHFPVVQVYELLSDYYNHPTSITGQLRDSRYVEKIRLEVEAIILN